MHNRDAITSTLYADQVDAEELAQIALDVFGTASQDSPESVTYHRAGQPPALIFSYSKNQLIAIKAGPGILDTDIPNIRKKVETDLLDPIKTIVGRAILFSTSPVTGYLNARSYFRIAPVPDHAPQPKDRWNGGFPFLIEFELYDSPNTQIKTNRIYSMARKISLFLNAVLKESISYPTASQRFMWVVKDVAGPVYDHLQEGYGYKEFQPWQDSFTESATTSTIELIDDQEYFSSILDWLVRPFQLPKVFEQLCEIYFGLNKATQDKFIRAAYWYSLVQNQPSSSAKFLHLIQCIETLLPDAESGHACSECKRNIGSGPTEGFVKFLENMVPGHTELAEGRRKLYKLRSSLSHGWDLFTRDLRPTMNPRSSDQLVRIHEAYTLAKLALISWLINQDQSTQSEADKSAVVPPA